MDPTRSSLKPLPPERTLQVRRRQGQHQRDRQGQGRHHQPHPPRVRLVEACNQERATSTHHSRHLGPLLALLPRCDILRDVLTSEVHFVDIVQVILILFYLDLVQPFHQHVTEEVIIFALISCTCI